MFDFGFFSLWEKITLAIFITFMLSKERNVPSNINENSYFTCNFQWISSTTITFTFKGQGNGIRMVLHSYLEQYQSQPLPCECNITWQLICVCVCVCWFFNSAVHFSNLDNYVLMIIIPLFSLHNYTLRNFNIHLHMK